MGDYSDAERAKFPKSAFCDPEHEAYPVLDAEDAGRAWLSRGRAQIDPDKIAACVVRKVRAHADWSRADLPQSLLDALKGDGKSADCPDCDADALLGALTHPARKSSGRMERKVCEDAQLKLLGPSDGPGIISGYASTWGNWDRSGERPVKGAFTPYLAAFLHDGFISAFHDWATLSVATLQDAHEDDYGLHFTAEFHSTTFAQDVRTTTAERLARGKSVKTSIGYEVAADEMVTREDTQTLGRLLKAVPLFEIAVVNVPMNPLADVTGVKDGLLAGQSWAAEADAVRATVSSFLQRTRAIAALRAKEGRALSAASRDKLAAVRDALAAHRDALGAHADEMDGLYTTLDTMLAPYEEPPPADKAARLDPARLRALHLDFLRLEARRLGVNV